MGYAADDDPRDDATRPFPVVGGGAADRIRYADSGRFPDAELLRDINRDQPVDVDRDQPANGDRSERAGGDGRQRTGGDWGERARGGPDPNTREYPVIDWYACYGRYPDDQPGSGY